MNPQEKEPYHARCMFIPFGGGDFIEKVLRIKSDNREQAKQIIENTEATQDGHKYKFIEWLF